MLHVMTLHSVMHIGGKGCSRACAWSMFIAEEACLEADKGIYASL